MADSQGLFFRWGIDDSQVDFGQNDTETFRAFCAFVLDKFVAGLDLGQLERINRETKSLHNFDDAISLLRKYEPDIDLKVMQYLSEFRNKQKKEGTDAKSS